MFRAQVDHPGVNIQGFPTLMFFPAGSQEVVNYNGARDLDGLTDFLKENAKVAFTLDGEDDDERDL